MNCAMPKEAEEQIAIALRSEPQNVSFLHQRARITCRKKRWKDALRQIDQALAIDASNVDLISLRTQVLTRLGRKAEAQASAQLHLSAVPDEDDPHLNAGELALRNGDPSMALESFKIALKMNPNSVRARNGVLTALRSRFIGYRWFFAYRRWVTSQPPAVRAVVAVGVFALIESLLIARRHFGSQAQAIANVLVGILAFLLVSSLLMNPLTSILLCFHPLGRMLLVSYRRVVAWWQLSSVAVGCLLAVISGGREGADYMPASLAAFAFSVLALVLLMEARESGRTRWVMFTALVVLEVLAVGGLAIATAIGVRI
jgi:tetratricopeptide (TPR) repeat protein